MRRVLKKLLICILICLIINNFFFSEISFATDGRSAIGQAVSLLLGSFVGLLTWPIRIFALAAGWAMDLLASQLAYSQGSIDANGNIIADTLLENNRITPFDILFNKIAVIDINFFNIPDDGSIISNMRLSIARWYYVMRNLASAILLCILIYVGIRMAITTVASDKAMYKKMLVDWVCSLAIIYVLQYIIIFTFSVNDVLVRSMATIGEQGDLDTAISNIAAIAWGISTDAIAATIIYCMLVAQTLGLFFSYFNRMLKIAFLLIVAPLITLTYSIDKMGDGKAQALGTWLKEFVYTVLIQPFHCIIYIAFVSMALEILEADPMNNLAGAILAMLCIRFTKDAEKILGKIFRFGEHASDASLAVGMAASAVALSKAKSIGKTTKTFVNGVRGSKGKIKNAIRNAKVDGLALKNFFTRDEHGNKRTLAQAKEAAEIEVTEKEAEKLANKNAKKYGVVSKENDFLKPENDTERDEFKKALEQGDLNTINNWKETQKDKYNRYQQYSYQQRIENATAANIHAGMSDKLAVAHARAQVAREVRNEKKDERFREKHRVLSKGKGEIARFRQFASQSETLRLLGNELKNNIRGGIAFAAGSGVYGAGKSAVESTVLGFAVNKSLEEAFKDTHGTLVNNVSQLLQGGGFKDSANAATEMTSIMARADDYEDAADFIDRLLKNIDNALGQLDGNDKKTIKNTITRIAQNEFAKNPLADNNDVARAIFANQTVKQIMEKGDVKREAIEGTVGESIDFYRQKAIYDTVKKAGELGIAPDSFVESSLKRFTNDTYANSVSEMSGLSVAANKAEAQDVIDRAVYGDEFELEDAERVIAGRLDRDVQDIERRIEDAIKSEYYSDYSDSIKNNLRLLYDAELKHKVETLLAEVEQYKNVLRSTVETEAQDELKAKIEFVRSELRSEVKLADKRWKSESRTNDAVVAKIQKIYKDEI